MRLFHPIPLGWLQLWHRKLRFAVEVLTDDGRTIGIGRHERRVVDTRPGGS